NYYISKGYDVTVITSKKANSSLVYKWIDKSAKVYEFSYKSCELILKDENDLSNIKVNKKTMNFGGGIRDFLVSFKRKVVNPIFGQIIDNRLPSIVSFIICCKLGINKVLLEGLNPDKTVIISTAPPWPSHLLAIYLSNLKKIPLYIDYRDPFSCNHMFSSNFSWLERSIDKRLCNKAKGVFTVSPSWVEYYRKFNENTWLLRNGYD
ncbi:hypothetical protein L4D21_27750, partial [Photobacterium profundum]|uniref:hypothetical protein n=1 Tax=Photobacterium profundum TaxID=74109 RepID=UPI003D0FA191